MASLADADLLSSDEEDDDYNPCEDKTGEPGDRPATTRLKRPRRAAAMAGGGRGGDSDDEEGMSDGSGGAQQEKEEAEECQEEVDTGPMNPLKLAKRAKIDAVWAALNSRETGGPNAAGPMGPPSSSKSLASLCGDKVKPHKKMVANPDLIWMKQLGLEPSKAPALNRSAATTLAGPTTTGAAGKAVSLVDEMWANQMGMKPQLHAKAAAQDEGNASLRPPSCSETAGSSSSSRSARGASASTEEARELAAAALANAKEAAGSGVGKNYGKVTVTETRRFAGKDIQVTVQVDKNSKAAAKANEPPAKLSGLDAFLAELETKKKVTVLDKSKMDWDQLKSTDAAMEEELEAYKKSSNKYLDKVDFLKKTELREYEMERDKRLASDIRTRGRL